MPHGDINKNILTVIHCLETTCKYRRFLAENGPTFNAVCGKTINPRGFKNKPAANSRFQVFKNTCQGSFSKVHRKWWDKVRAGIEKVSKKCFGRTRDLT